MLDYSFFQKDRKNLLPSRLCYAEDQTAISTERQTKIPSNFYIVRIFSGVFDIKKARKYPGLLSN